MDLPPLPLPWPRAGLLSGAELPGFRLPGALGLALAPALPLSLREGKEQLNGIPGESGIQILCS